MSIKYVVQKGVEIPKAGRGSGASKYPFSSMGDGDSFGFRREDRTKVGGAARGWMGDLRRLRCAVCTQAAAPPHSAELLPVGTNILPSLLA